MTEKAKQAHTNPKPEDITPELIGKAIKDYEQQTGITPHTQPTRGSLEWGSMWLQLHLDFGEPDLEGAPIPTADIAMKCPDTGEVWQYMGTYQHTSCKLWHEFRHRSLKGKRTYHNILTEYDRQAWGHEPTQLEGVQI